MSNKLIAVRTLFTFTGMIAAIMISFMARLLCHIFNSPHQLDFMAILGWQFIWSLPFAMLFLLDIPMRFSAERRTRKILLKHLTFVATTCLGVIGNLLMVSDLPDAFNSYITPLWFVFGFMFFNLGGARFLDTILYGLLYVFSLILGMIAWDVAIGPDEHVSYLLIAFQLLTFIPIALMSRSKNQAIQHAFKQLEKVFYRHQIQQIRKGNELEETMPTTPSTAFVISFDIIESSKIDASKGKELFRAVFQRCNAIMIQGYDGKQLMARAYRVKEMGDGFLCSVGYPFRYPEGSLADGALQLAEEFYQAFVAEASRLAPQGSIHCGIGIAFGPISGFYPETPPKEYDLYGQSLVLAKRYEGMRKILLKGQAPASILILQEQVYRELDSSRQAGFLCCELEQCGFVIRDDPAARSLYYSIMHRERPACLPPVHSAAGNF
ncbi:hypothetical protein [Oligoflexus tunisiensis]|uniref:hypothetical protein n=1 Tax=Oligoflexus tunisiensis TaxID=708132 RepID=UPI00114D0FBF|nr:hypothetical protein [Oligoflexus tunisiensis]